MEEYQSPSSGTNERPDRPEWTACNSIGLAGEQAVAGLFQKIGLAVVKIRERCADLEIGGRIEVKTDRRACRTGDVAVEVAHYDRASGIHSTGAGCWAFVLSSGEVILIGAARLRTAVAGLPDKPAGEHATVRLLPLAELRRLGISIGGGMR